MPENVTEVIGFDLGLRETILARLRLDYPYAQPETIEIHHEKETITAIGYHPTKGILIGEAALRTAGVTECYIDFNKIPNNDPICQRAMHDFVQTIYRFILDSGMVEGDETRFIVGYPTEWCKDKALVRAYEQAFSQAGIPNVTAIAESGAALLHAVESGIFRLSESYQPILLIDIGSAITNFFLVDVKNKKSTLYDVGFNLEAALIEKAIYQFTLENHPQKEELKKIFERYPHLRNRCEMICRKVKEDYFTNPHLYQESGDYVPACAVNIQNLYLFMPEIDGPVMEEILHIPLAKIDGGQKTWPEAFEHALKTLREQVEMSGNTLTPEFILLTGEASRMDFLHEICKNVFPRASIKLDDEPEFSVAKGLAQWGKGMEEMKQARNETDEYINVSCFPNLIDAINNVSIPDQISNCQNMSSRRWMMPENITEVIGFDLGHGETALTRLRLEDKDIHSHPEPIEIFNKKNIITAIGYHPTDGIMIGEAAIRDPNVTESRITFKERPSSNPEYKIIMHDFIKKIYNHLLEQGKIDAKKSLFIVGCPSEWSRDKTLVRAYEQIFNQAGIQNVTVIAESRAALLHAVESKMFDMGELKRPVLVIDVGSSTTDFTLVDAKDKKSMPFDIGRDLGAALIDKAIFRHTLDNHPQKEDLKKIFEQYLYLQNRCELVCRRGKEEYFTNPKIYNRPGSFPSAGAENIQRRCIFMPEIDGPTMDEILKTPLVELDGEIKTWPDAFEHELLKLRAQVKSSENTLSPEVILLTGGASRMDFIPQICKKVFPQAQVKPDDAPEFCIAKGLARWGRVDIRTRKFTEEIEKFCSEKIRPKVEGHIDSLYSSVASKIADEVINIIKNDFYRWKSGTYITIDSMHFQIDSDIDHLMQKDSLSDLFRYQIRTLFNDIAKELSEDITDLEKKYAIPIGFLGGSFNLGSPEINSFSLGSHPKMDPMDGMTEELGNIIGWISAILAGAVAFLVAPTILAIITVIIATISMTLGGIIFAILISNPAGIAILAAIGIFALVAGADAKEKIEKLMPSWDLPQWVRNRVNSSSVYFKIDEQKSAIVNQVTSKLKEDSKTRQQIIDKITGEFQKSLLDRADDARLLID